MNKKVFSGLLVCLFLIITIIIITRTLNSQHNYPARQEVTLNGHHELSVRQRRDINSYYDFLINEWSFKFWAIFQLVTIAILLYSTFAAIYFAKYTYLRNPPTDEDFRTRRALRAISKPPDF